MEAIEHPPIFRLPGIPDHVTYTWLVMVILAALTFVASRNMQLVPRGLQNVFEVGVGVPLLDAVIFLLVGLRGRDGGVVAGGVAGAVHVGVDGIVTIVFPLGLLSPLMILVAFRQAFIFVILTVLYISGAIEKE